MPRTLPLATAMLTLLLALVSCSAPDPQPAADGPAAELPAVVPADLPLVDGEVVTAVEEDTPDGAAVSVTVASDHDWGGTVTQLNAAVADSGWEFTDPAAGAFDTEPAMMSLRPLARGDDWSGVVSIQDDPDGDAPLVAYTLDHHPVE